MYIRELAGWSDQPSCCHHNAQCPLSASPLQLSPVVKVVCISGWSQARSKGPKPEVRRDESRDGGLWGGGSHPRAATPSPPAIADLGDRCPGGFRDSAPKEVGFSVFWAPVNSDLFPRDFDRHLH